MDFAKAVHLLGEGLEHWATACKVARWQYDQGQLFLMEHPLPSRAWDEQCSQELMQLPGVFVVRADQCAFGLRVREHLNKKPTQFVTNCPFIAAKLSLKCSGDHIHEPLLGGKAAAAAIYPPALCKAIVRGLRKHLRVKNGVASVPQDKLTVLAASRPSEHDLDDFEDLLPDEVREFRQEQRERRRAEAAVTAYEKAQVTKMHAPNILSATNVLADLCQKRRDLQWCRSATDLV